MGILSQKPKRRKRLTESQIADLRAAEGRQVDIAIRFGVSQAQVSMVKNGKRRTKGSRA